jgi:arylsulfatase A-like enzyme
VVLTFDRLPLRFLGPYGSLLCQTPHLDRLASTACVFDSHFAEDLDESRKAHAWWTAPSPGDTTLGDFSLGLPSRLRERGIGTRLVLDRPPAGWSLAPAGFDITHVVEPSEEQDFSRFAELMSSATRQWAEPHPSNLPFLLWIHSSELSEIPLPSMEFLEMYLDELSESRSESELSFCPEEEQSEENFAEPLELIEQTLEHLQEGETELDLQHLKVLHVLTAARISEIDHELGKLVARLEQSPDWPNTLLILTSDQGLTLGEAVLTRRLDPLLVTCPLTEQRMHVPLIVKAGDSSAFRRSACLTQHADLAGTLMDWFGVAENRSTEDAASLLPLIDGAPPSPREISVSRADDWHAIRDRDWQMIINRTQAIERLYRVPEDRHQVLNVLAHHVETAERLKRELDRRIDRGGD